MFRDAFVTNLSISTSDHKPILLSLVGETHSRRYRRFRFENCWVTRKECSSVVEAGWNLELCAPILNRISSTSAALEGWGKAIMPKFSKRIEAKKVQIEAMQNRADEEGARGLIRCTSDLHNLPEEEEVFWKQRAKFFWLKAGGSNSKFFHNVASDRKRRNRISKLRDEQGEWKSAEKDITNCITYKIEMPPSP
ncbi:uncharacterized protein LOC126661692 [Mercurialis annua]|uniref:uncharacterized protein LOC126661692 n=1 Tax=Mercurialis annua TaxID=3986 RepID=UPI00215FEBC0|nr:uncharacterized protein LOC126661692 [Mercurialis annua]